jgi:uncharacterized protein YecT (DUF1311 family)
MKFVATAALLVLMTKPSLAQDSPAYRECAKNAGTQYESNVCAFEEVKRVEAEMARVYDSLLSRATGIEGGPEAPSKIRVMQDAWITYRDAYIEARYPAENTQFEYGTIYVMNSALMRARLARRQITALRELLPHYPPKTVSLRT